MERELWRWIARTLKAAPRTRPRNAVYTDSQIAAVYLWAVLHDRPVSWACRRENWPMQAWRRELPDQSTMSRRMRRPEMRSLMRDLLERIQRTFDRGEVLIVDGKGLHIGPQSRDPDAHAGYAAGRIGKGYKLHLILDAQSQAVVAHETHPMNIAEPTTAAELMRDASSRIPPKSLLLGDCAFDSNPLHAAAHTRDCQLIAPRHRPRTGLSNQKHHPNRFESMRFTEGTDEMVWRQTLHPIRVGIERFFGALASASGGLIALPAWVRRLHRVRLWVAAKLIVNAARIAARRGVHA